MKEKIVPEMISMAVVIDPKAFESALKLSFVNKRGRVRHVAMVVSDNELLSDFVLALRNMANYLEEEL